MISSVRRVVKLSQTTVLLELEKCDLDFRVGQCVSLGLEGLGVNREYSIASGVDSDCLKFLIKVVDGGVLTPRLAVLTQGDAVTLQGPFGSFMSEIDQGSNNLFVCTGTGIAPFVSFLETYRGSLNATLLQGVRERGDLFELGERQGLEVINCVSRDASWSGSARVTEALSSLDLTLFDGVYVCGNRKMIASVYEELVDRGYSSSQIFVEAFF